MITIGVKTYKLVFLDTNALREISLDAYNSRRGFSKRFFNPNNMYAPCFSFYNVAELMPYLDIYEKFTNFFSIVPCLMFFPEKTIVKHEYSCFLKKTPPEFSQTIANGFSPFRIGQDASLSGFLKKTLSTDFQKVLKHEIDQFPTIADLWERQRINTNSSSLRDSPLNEYNDQYYFDREKNAILRDIANRGLPYRKDYDLYYFPSLRLFEYSHYNRVLLTTKKITPNDVMDVEISGIIPYVDAAVTEKFQGNVLRKAKNFIPQIKRLEVFTLKDIRDSDTAFDPE